MKKQLVLTAITLTMTLFVGCGSASNVSENTGTVTESPTSTTESMLDSTATSEETETPHEHTYVETITTEATCETDGEATYTCKCGDTYTETITASGHIYENYTSNNDATYLADGTETAKCNGCDLTDTRTAEGSKLEYTYNEMDVTMYAQKTVNVRSMPSTDGEKLGGLSTNDEVKVTGQCIETNWYRIEYDGSVAYVSDGYLGNDKVVVQSQSSSTQAGNSGAPKTISSTEESANYPNVIYVNVCAGSVSYPGSLPERSLGKCPYPIGVIIDNEDGTHTLYSVKNHGGHLNGAWIDFTPQGGDALPAIGIYSADCYPYDEGCVHKWVW